MQGHGWRSICTEVNRGAAAIAAADYICHFGMLTQGVYAVELRAQEGTNDPSLGIAQTFEAQPSPGTGNPDTAKADTAKADTAARRARGRVRAGGSD